MDNGNIVKLNKYHVIFLIQNTMIGIGLFSLPNDISAVGYNQWLIPILLGVLANITLIPIVMLCLKYPRDSLFKITEKLLGKVVGKIVNATLLLYGIASASSVVSDFSRLVQGIVLPTFTINPFVISTFIVVIAIVLGGIKSVARFCMFSFFMTGWMIAFLQWPLQAGNWIHLYPTFEVGWNDWLTGMYEGSIAMFGYGLILFYFPYIQEQKKAFLHASIGIWIAVIYYFLVSVAAVIYFSPWQIDNLLYPVLNLFQAIQLPFVERIENFGTTLWVFLVLSTAATYLWIAKKGMDALFNKHKNRTWHVYVAAILAVLIILGPIPIDLQRQLYDEWVVYYGYGVIALPSFLLLIHAVKTKLGNQQQKKEVVT
ncbi:spore germination protein [Halalkalibacter wakoensis JCM 9140]|uniref:Spore germination protein n=1 Tax=Halalkalibacter wakoensis JCM 9140 TaxID=1236970 RepID=W4PYG3_9BACI|nr:endospore germination permease [Halalkalibacter wakoensis]GAE24503.1 spore germination protein [Halalkalibacter wakoensis JCM 9140]